MDFRSHRHTDSQPTAPSLNYDFFLRNKTHSESFGFERIVCETLRERLAT